MADVTPMAEVDRRLAEQRDAQRQDEKERCSKMRFVPGVGMCEDGAHARFAHRAQWATKDATAARHARFAHRAQWATKDATAAQRALLTTTCAGQPGM